MKLQINFKFIFLSLLSAALFCFTAYNASANGLKTSDTTAMQKYPQQSTDISPLLIGEKIPSVNIPAANGKPFDLNAHLADKPTILFFYRGGWCPFCNKELAGVQGIQAELVKTGYQIIAISTDSPDNLNKSMDKHKLSYTLLSDADLAVSKQFGIAFKAPAAYSKILAEGSAGKNADKLLPVPSVFILDKSGIIQFEYINPDFKQRISPTLLQAVAAALKQENPVK
ncbi:peroxiredoxin-like family protein [Mucilaginibacter sabulilitoris]|uniref:thioredoxin-dependent peroxiredoxin n=1 Tax=Mucilaginibacter sabulilitoris TaxID=1173583 RepID=A0ABZ0TNH6_9SPHI|nr:peroxiredoxin-like family protein [Mucilaginibacter sabulilitoris]WPU94710.1 peroxiredoxin-like family protein [Mucilaginibacter sabulilitoris]